MSNIKKNINVCTRCGSSKNLIRSTKYKSKILGLRQYHICNPCNNERCIAYYHSLTGSKKQALIKRHNKWHKTPAGKRWSKMYWIKKNKSTKSKKKNAKSKTR